MKVLHFILGKANKDRANGVNQVIAGLAKYSGRLGADVRVIGKAETVQREGEIVVRDGFSVEAYSRWDLALRRALIEGIAWADLVHMHGVYAPWNVWVGHLCKRLDTPFVVTLHNGLAPDLATSRGRLKKRLFHFLLQRRHLRNAAALHMLTEEESTEVLACVRPRAMFCIPNGIDLEDFPPPPGRRPGEIAQAVIGYLGRLSAEKNLGALCEAFALVNKDGSLRLKLAGPDSRYSRLLLQQFGRCGVEWVGPKFGQDKMDFIRSLDLFVNPSLCDVFSIAAMEVLALGTPLLITRTAKVSYFYDRRAFHMCEPTVFGIERGLRQALVQRLEWPEMATRGRELIGQRLNWASAARDLLGEYERTLDGSKK